MKVTIATILMLTVTGCTNLSEQVTKRQETSPTTTFAATRPKVPDQSAPDWVGAVVNVHDLREGDCFNQYSWSNDERLIEIDTKVSCSGPHQNEIYLVKAHPARSGAPWPGDREMDAFATTECYNAFSDFVGQIYELSDLNLGFLTPSRRDFENDLAQFRNVHCYVYLDAKTESVGTARGSRR